jgi:hypothetical protein
VERLRKRLGIDGADATFEHSEEIYTSIDKTNFDGYFDIPLLAAIDGEL